MVLLSKLRYFSSVLQTWLAILTKMPSTRIWCSYARQLPSREQRDQLRSVGYGKRVNGKAGCSTFFPCLKSILPDVYLDHFALLSHAVYLLLGDRIARYYLEEFCSKMRSLYGIE